MADEGNKIEGQEEAAPSMNDMIEQANADLQLAPPPPPESYDDWRASIKASEGWLQAIAKDERAERVQSRHRDSAASQRSQAATRAMYRARQDWRRTVQRIEQRPYYPPPSEPRAPYAKGNPEAFWGKFLTGIFRALGLA